MNSANSTIGRAPRATTPQTMRTDPKKRDLETRVAAADNDLLRRWERLAEETARG